MEASRLLLLLLLPLLLLLFCNSVAATCSCTKSCSDAKESESKCGCKHEEETKQLPRSCKEIKLKTKTKEDGIYCLQTKSGQFYQAFCDMNTNGGGWTLVASVHENNIAAKCAIGDRWSSQQGSNPAVGFVDGDRSWANLNTFGRIESATDDDYKNPGYFDVDAEDISVWHVPNGTPLAQWKISSIFRYHTASEFLTALGGNLYFLYKIFYPLVYGSGTCPASNGPAIPIVYDFGNTISVASQVCPACLGGTLQGYVHLRVFNNERAPFALCSGLRVLDNCNTEHYCIGGAGYVPEQTPRQCGDFSAFDWSGIGTHVEWSASKSLLEAAVFIFYR
ncbi:intelectin-1a-like [Lampetra fluviatilis]